LAIGATVIASLGIAVASGVLALQGVDVDNQLQDLKLKGAEDALLRDGDLSKYYLAAIERRRGAWDASFESNMMIFGLLMEPLSAFSAISGAVKANKARKALASLAELKDGGNLLKNY